MEEYTKLIVGCTYIFSTSLGICILIIRKFRHDIEPVHLFLVNYYGWLFLHCVIKVAPFLQHLGIGENSCFENLVLLSTFLAFSLGTVCFQADRFLAISRPMRYKDIVTNTRAIAACVTCAVIVGLLAIGTYLVDPDLAVCLNPPFLLFTRFTTLVLISSTRLLAILSIMVVLLYSWQEHLRLNSNLVHPTMGNINTCQERHVSDLSRTRRTNSDPNMFFHMRQQRPITTVASATGVNTDNRTEESNSAERDEDLAPCQPHTTTTNTNQEDFSDVLKKTAAIS